MGGALLDFLGFLCIHECDNRHGLDFGFSNATLVNDTSALLLIVMWGTTTNTFRLEELLWDP